MQSVERWVADGIGKQSLRPYEKKGNNAATVLRGEDRVLVAVIRAMYPKANAAEVITFVHAHSSNPRLYAAGQISQCEIDLGLTRKVGSTTAFQALTPANVLRRFQFWNLPFPSGVTDTPLERLCDIDECAVTLNVVNRAYGKSYVNMRVNEEGPYVRTEKRTLILGVRPNGTPLWRFSSDPGTSADVFGAYLEENVFPHLQDPTTLMWDNLFAHNAASVTNIVAASPHRILHRPNYRPQDGPVEYANNQLLTKMRVHCYSITTLQELDDAMPMLIASLTNMRSTFEMCGY